MYASCASSFVSKYPRDTSFPFTLICALHFLTDLLHAAPRNPLLRWAVPALYLAGIVATFLREVVLAATYGTSTEIEVFRIAFAVPNMLSTSLGPAFVAAVVPALMRAERGEVVARTRIGDGKTADIVLGRKFRLDVELVEKVKEIQGVKNVELAPVKPHLMSVR